MNNVRIFDRDDLHAVPATRNLDIEPRAEPYPIAVETVVCRLANRLKFGGDAVPFNLVYPFNPAINSSASTVVDTGLHLDR